MAAAFLTLAAAPALAKETHVFKEAFASSGSGAGQVSLRGASAALGITGSGVAVNQSTGDIYIGDTANHRVDQFSETGAFIRAFGADVGGLGVDICTVTCAPGSPGSGAGELEAPTFVAIDNTLTGAGAVYVADSTAKTVTKYEANGTLDTTWGVGGQLAGFERVDGIAVDTSGVLYVAQGQSPNPLAKFESSGSPTGTVGLEFEALPTGFAVDAAGALYKVRGSGIVAKLNSTGEALIGELGAGYEATALAVDPANEDPYIAHGAIVDRYSPAGQQLESFTSPELGSADGLAVGASQRVYVADAAKGRIDIFTAAILPNVVTLPPSGLEPTSAILNGEVDPAGGGPVTDCHFVVSGAIGNVPCDQTTPITSPTPVTATVILQPNTNYTYHVVATNASGSNEGATEGFRAPGPPVVESQSSSAVSATSATVEATINPEQSSTHYHFEYITEAAFLADGASFGAGSVRVPVPDQPIGEGSAGVAIAANIEDLAPATNYRFRVVAANDNGPVAGEPVALRTQAPAASPLPDHRGYELVSPPNKQGSIVEPISGSGLIQSSASGEAITYYANGPTEAGLPGNSQTVQILSRHAGPATSPWLSQDIATPHSATVGVGLGVGNGEYRFFSEDLSQAIVQPLGPFTPSLSPQASEQTTYLRNDFPPGDPTHPCNTSCYRPLVTGCPGGGQPCPAPVAEAADVPEGTKIAEAVPAEGGNCKEHCAPYFLGASSDAAHIVLAASGAPLLEGAPEGAGGSLYEWTGGRLSLVSVLPSGIPAAASTHPVLGDGPPNIRIARHAISSDGNRVIWSEAVGEHHLYLFDLATEESIQLDAPEAACIAGGGCGGPAHAAFQTASTDGSRIFFTDSQALTEGSGNSDLYECQIEEAEEELACKLSDLTPPGLGEEGAGVIGLVAGTAEDGTTIYFTANGKLSEETNAHREEAVAGDCKADTRNEAPESETAAEQCNLYVRRNGQTRLVAVLSGADFPDWALREVSGLRGLTARVSPEGRYLAFMSRRQLTGYDNRDVASGAPDQEVFLYDGATDTLRCASCNPSGARPHGVEYAHISTQHSGEFAKIPPGIAGGSELWPPTAWIAASIPGWTAISETEGFALHQSRYLSDQGRLFFNSADALVPGDSNGTEDVYQYEPPASEPGTPAGNTCTTSSPTYSQAGGGCVDLISSGTSGEESAFMDASESGEDVFFLTSSRLSKRDVDTAADLYDARVGGGEEEAVRPVECTGDACQQPAVPPNAQTPGSLTFQGAGNVVECPKGKIKKHGRCVKEKAKKHHKKSKKRHAKVNQGASK